MGTSKGLKAAERALGSPKAPSSTAVGESPKSSSPKLAAAVGWGETVPAAKTREISATTRWGEPGQGATQAPKSCQRTPSLRVNTIAGTP